MAVTIINTIDAKKEFSDLMNRVAHHKEHVVFTRREKEIAVLISVEDWHLLQELQSKHDLEEAVEAFKDAREHGTITLADLKEQIG